MHESNEKQKKRGKVTVNPVTGELRVKEGKGEAGDAMCEDTVTEGCLKIPKRYLHAAAEAGLGSSNGAVMLFKCSVLF